LQSLRYARLMITRKGEAKPEWIMTFNNDASTILVMEKIETQSANGDAGYCPCFIFQEYSRR
jgi:hypothetical protein